MANFTPKKVKKGKKLTNIPLISSDIESDEIYWESDMIDDSKDLEGFEDDDLVIFKVMKKIIMMSLSKANEVKA